MRFNMYTKMYVTDCKYEMRIAFCAGKRKVRTVKDKTIDDDGVIESNDKSIADSVRRARRMIVDYAMCNDFDIFGTITLSDEKVDILDVVGIKDRLLKLLDNYRQTVAPDFEYILVPEYGELNGRLHFHFVARNFAKGDIIRNEHHYLDIPFISERFGFVSIKRITGKRLDRVRIAKYCSKYISKDCIQICKQRYYVSKTLAKPEKFECSCSDCMTVNEWLCFNDMEPYYNDKFGKAFALPVQIYEKMMDFCKVSPVIKPFLTLLPDDFPCPFDVGVQLCV